MISCTFISHLSTNTTVWYRTWWVTIKVMLTNTAKHFHQEHLYKFNESLYSFQTRDIFFFNKLLVLSNFDFGVFWMLVLRIYNFYIFLNVIGLITDSDYYERRKIKRVLDFSAFGINLQIWKKSLSIEKLHFEWFESWT